MSTVNLTLPILPVSIALTLPSAPVPFDLDTDIVTAREFSAGFSIDFQ